MNIPIMFQLITEVIHKRDLAMNEFLLLKGKDSSPSFGFKNLISCSAIIYRDSHEIGLII